jgi:hypothetical protein
VRRSIDPSRPNRRFALHFAQTFCSKIRHYGFFKTALEAAKLKFTRETQSKSVRKVEKKPYLNVRVVKWAIYIDSGFDQRGPPPEASDGILAVAKTLFPIKANLWVTCA